MRRAITFCSLLAFGMFEVDATPATDVRNAILGLLAQPNFQWSRECEWVSLPDGAPTSSRPEMTTVTLGRTEKDGFTVATMEIAAPAYLARVPGPYHTVKGVFAGKRGVVDFGKGWLSATDITRLFQQRNRLLEEREKQGVASVMLWASSFVLSGEAMPEAMLRTIADECVAVVAVGSAFSLQLSPTGERQMLDFARRHTTAFLSGPVEEVSRCGMKCWLYDGHLTKLEVHLLGRVGFMAAETPVFMPRRVTPADPRNIDYRATIVFSNAGAAEVSVPKDAREKLREPEPSDNPEPAGAR